jgi:hypothetical protein
MGFLYILVAIVFSFLMTRTAKKVVALPDSIPVVNWIDGLKQLRWLFKFCDRLCGLVVRVLGYRSGGPVSIPGTTRKRVVGLERGPLSLVSTTEELLDRKVAAPV